ncbi:serine hydrolase domain-containing protein [Spirillospora sp. NPDC127200]
MPKRSALSRFAVTVVVLAAAGAGSGLAATAADAAEPKHEATQTALDQHRLRRAAIGAGAVVRDGATMWSLTSGSRELGRSLPFGPEHRIRAGSLTKTFTAAMMMQLVDEGKVDLDASVETYLPGVVQGKGYDGDQISVRQMLNHSSGIYDYVSVALRNPQLQLRRFTLAEVARLGLDNPPYFEPGKGYQYSGTNFILAGMIIEAVTGRSYIDELTSRIIKPLGLTETFVPVGTKALPPGHVRGYLGRIVYVDVTQTFEPSLGGSSGGIVTSGADATRFMQALVTGKLTSPASLKEMLTPLKGSLGSAEGRYGQGIFSIPLPCGGEAWGHNGIWPGYESNTVATKDGRSAFVAVNVFDPFGGAVSNPGGATPLEQAAATALCDRN